MLFSHLEKKNGKRKEKISFFFTHFLHYKKKLLKICTKKLEKNTSIGTFYFFVFPLPPSPSLFFFIYLAFDEGKFPKRRSAEINGYFMFQETTGTGTKTKSIACNRDRFGGQQNRKMIMH